MGVRALGARRACAPSRPREGCHVAIYLGNDMIIDAYGPVDVHSMWLRGVPRGVLRFYQ